MTISCPGGERRKKKRRFYKLDFSTCLPRLFFGRIFFYVFRNEKHTKPLKNIKYADHFVNVIIARWDRKQNISLKEISRAFISVYDGCMKKNNQYMFSKNFNLVSNILSMQNSYTQLEKFKNFI